MNTKWGQAQVDNTSTLGPGDLASFLAGQAIPGEMLHLDALTPTVEMAAQAVGTAPDNIVKSILFLVGDEPVLTITCGQAYVERRQVASLYGVGRKKVKLASPEEVLRETGYPVGAMPPFGHRQPLPTLIDRRVLERLEVYAGGGADDTLLRISPQVILRVTQARVLDLTGSAVSSEPADVD